MLIGVPKEIKNQEYRVGMLPSSIRELVGHGHQIIVESDAALGIGFTNEQYIEAGAMIAKNAEEVFNKADMIVKVKEPQPSECRMLRKDQILFTYLHLAPDPLQTQLLLESGCTAIAYETVTDAANGLPLLSPMSEVAGRMAIQAGAHCLEKSQGGSGTLISGVPGVAPANVVVIGGGVVGTNALRIAIGMQAKVTVLEKSLKRLKELELLFGPKLLAIYATADALEHYVSDADLVIGAVLIPGAAAPKLVSRELLSRMRPGSVIVDVAIDQGGCFESSRVTTHTHPTYIEHDVVHYCVGNMPGGVPKTATCALNNATLPFIIELANKGLSQAVLSNPHLMNGVNIHKGEITYEAVAAAFDKHYVPADVAITR